MHPHWSPATLSPLMALVLTLAVASFLACAGTRVDATEARNTANEMREDLNAIVDELDALAPTMRALCSDPSPAFAEWCGDADRMWQVARRAIAAAHLGVDLYERGGVEVQHALEAIQAAEDGCAALVKSIEAARKVAGK